MLKTRKAAVWQGIRLGLTEYQEALALQRRIAETLIRFPDRTGVVLFLEHPPVFTLGRRGGMENLRVSHEFLSRQHIPVIPTDRGGDITFHGPGQLVVYPILHLAENRLSIPELVSGLEEVMIRTIGRWEVVGERNPVNHGVWVNGKKIGSIGIHIRKSVSIHGMALNVNNDLEPFEWIHPCGLSGVSMTSLRRECGKDILMEQAAQETAGAIRDVFGADLAMSSGSFLPPRPIRNQGGEDQPS
jgi:lipoate-protein ligase B